MEITKAFEERIKREGIVDADQHRYTYNIGHDSVEIKRIELAKLGTPAAYRGWETVKQYTLDVYQAAHEREKYKLKVGEDAQKSYDIRCEDLNPCEQRDRACTYMSTIMGHKWDSLEDAIDQIEEWRKMDEQDHNSCAYAVEVYSDEYLGDVYEVEGKLFPPEEDEEEEDEQ